MVYTENVYNTLLHFLIKWKRNVSKRKNGTTNDREMEKEEKAAEEMKIEKMKRFSVTIFFYTFLPAVRLYNVQCSCNKKL